MCDLYSVGVRNLTIQKVKFNAAPIYPDHVICLQTCDGYVAKVYFVPADWW